jgi:hypothetical protein
MICSLIRQILFKNEPFETILRVWVLKAEIHTHTLTALFVSISKISKKSSRWFDSKVFFSSLVLWYVYEFDQMNKELKTRWLGVSSFPVPKRSLRTERNAFRTEVFFFYHVLNISKRLQTCTHAILGAFPCVPHS